MDSTDHWNEVYRKKSEDELSWHQDDPSASLKLIKEAGVATTSAIIDIGAGTSHLMGRLIDLGLNDLSALDVSESALDAAHVRLGEHSRFVKWIVADITTWEPRQTYDIWHDRAVFHFLIHPEHRAAYIERLSRSVAPGGHVIIATFAIDGPAKCSGLPVVRYSPDSLLETLGEDFSLLSHQSYLHHTPWGSEQPFQYSLLRKAS